jgi:hypothetical protein
MRRMKHKGDLATLDKVAVRTTTKIGGQTVMRDRMLE